jgi:CBS domain-containing protein
MKQVKELLELKSNNIWSVTSDATVYSALKLMADKDIGALLVMQNNKLSGIFTERDYARKVILDGLSSHSCCVSDIMTAKVLCVKSSTTVEECMALMTNKRIRHLPVIDGDQVIGLISIGDLVKAIIEEQKFLIDQLQHYISGY